MEKNYLDEISSYIGREWDDKIEMQSELELLLPGEVFFGDESKVPFSSARRIEIYNEECSYMLDFIRDDETGKVRLVDVSGPVLTEHEIIKYEVRVATQEFSRGKEIAIEQGCAVNNDEERNVIKMCDSLEEARDVMAEHGSYIEDFNSFYRVNETYIVEAKFCSSDSQEADDWGDIEDIAPLGIGLITGEYGEEKKGIGIYPSYEEAKTAEREWDSSHPDALSEITFNTGCCEKDFWEKYERYFPLSEGRAGLLSLELPDGDILYVKLQEKITVKDVLDYLAGAENAYLELNKIEKERIRSDVSAGYEQSGNCKFTIEAAMNSDTVHVCEINAGKGGIPETERTEKNTKFTEYSLCDYLSKEEKKQEQEEKKAKNPDKKKKAKSR